MKPEGSLPFSQDRATGLKQFYQVHVLTPYFFKTNFNITILTTKKCSKWSLPKQHFVCMSLVSHAYYKPHPTHPPNFITVTILAERHKLNCLLQKYKNIYNQTNQSFSEFYITTLSLSFNKFANSPVFIHNLESIYRQKNLIPNCRRHSCGFSSLGS